MIGLGLAIKYYSKKKRRLDKTKLAKCQKLLKLGNGYMRLHYIVLSTFLNVFKSS